MPATAPRPGQYADSGHLDRTVAAMSDFAAGITSTVKHFGINWDRDVATPVVADP